MRERCTAFDEHNEPARPSAPSRLTGGWFPGFIFLLFIVSTFVSCSSKKQQADLIVHNAVVYTVDSVFTSVQSFAVKDGKILATGTNEDIANKYDAAEKIDAQGKAVYPGFIDAHCHFYGYGQSLHSVNLVGTKSWDEVIERTIEFSKTAKSEWITGRGWDQNDWATKQFPTRKQLDSLFPKRPVMLLRIDGHAAMVNNEALKRAGITIKTHVEGGEVIYVPDSAMGGFPLGPNGERRSDAFQLSGILIDNAVDLVNKVIPAPTVEEMSSYLLDAQKNCFEVGLTTVDDAGLMKKVIDAMDTLQKEGKLKIRIYAMLTDSAENFNYYLEHGPYKTDRLNVRSFKVYGDGALGSRGACLLEPYADQPGHKGFLLHDPSYYEKYARMLAGKGFQLNTHCIGDSASRLLLDIYNAALKGQTDQRWRIEHAQIVSSSDVQKFKGGNIISSVQPTHATSDMYWVKERIGEKRAKTAYAYKDLLKAAGKLALGTDFPVEGINPMSTFYAAVARMDKDGKPEGGFQMENALTREETLRGMTIWAAYSNFEEKEKGSIEAGKFADFVILDKDIMKVDMKEVLSTKVIATYVNGEKVYGK